MSILPLVSPRHSGAALLIAAGLLISACAQTMTLTPLPAALSLGDNVPEDLTVSGSTAYVSNIATGAVLKLDLSNAGAATPFISAATDAYSSAWGLRVIPGKNWLLSIQNQPYDFNPAHAKAGRVTAYDLSNGTKVKSWSLPEGMVGNSVVVDGTGNFYVGDIGPKPRVVKIDAATDTVTTWATSPDWKDGGFGIGGMAYSGSGVYASHNNALWYIGLKADGSAAVPQQVKIEGDPVVFADGMSWVDGSVIYAENDVLVPGAHGSVFQLKFSGPTTATRTLLKGELRDPSGVAVATVGGASYLLVEESQLGFAFGVDKGEASKPYQIKVFPR